MKLRMKHFQRKRSKSRIFIFRFGTTTRYVIATRFYFCRCLYNYSKELTSVFLVPEVHDHLLGPSEKNVGIFALRTVAEQQPGGSLLWLRHA